MADNTLALCRRRLRFVNPFGISYRTRTTHDIILARWERDGRACFGEISPYYGETLDESAAALVHAADLLERGASGAWANLSIDDLPARLPHNPSARAAIDLMWLDALGKELNAPLWRVLGTDPARAGFSSFTIGLASIEETLRKVEDARAFKALKIKLGKSPEHDLEVIRQIRRAAPDTILRVDANSAWTLDFAKEAAKVLADLGVELLEQPLGWGRFEELRQLRSASPIPIFADEDCRSPADVAALAGAVDGVVVKLMKQGGVAAALRTIHAARAHGMKVMLGCMIETSVAISAASALAPLVDCADLDGCLLVSNDPFEGATLGPAGEIRLSDAPGLGARPRADLEEPLKWIPAREFIAAAVTLPAMQP
jgi:L-alanine-DL-glutamate epimerase-like enolase superfamily enzyme